MAKTLEEHLDEVAKEFGEANFEDYKESVGNDRDAEIRLGFYELEATDRYYKELLADKDEECKHWEKTSILQNEALHKAVLEIAELQRSRWISVEDRLPELNDTEVIEVICFLEKSKEVCQAQIYIEFKEIAWQIYGGNLLSTRQISHWMPLPEAPTT